VQNTIGAYGYKLNPMSGVPGDFYTTAREYDLFRLIHHVLQSYLVWRRLSDLAEYRLPEDRYRDNA
jgi:hypothetical protein